MIPGARVRGCGSSWELLLLRLPPPLPQLVLAMLAVASLHAAVLLSVAAVEEEAGEGEGEGEILAAKWTALQMTALQMTTPREPRRLCLRLRFRTPPASAILACVLPP